MSYSGYYPTNKRQRENKVFTKIVVRRLPPNFTSEIFKEQVSPLPAYNYFYFVSGDKAGRNSPFSRVYINLVHAHDVFSFKEKYDGYVFLGLRGAEYPAVVEYAPFQRVPKIRLFQNRDTKCGTIQNNEYYLQFVESLKLPKYDSFERPEYDLQLNLQQANHENVTPLLKYISAKKSEQTRSRPDRKRETIRQSKSDNCRVFVNSSVRKSGQQWLHMKKHV